MSANSQLYSGKNHKVITVTDLPIITVVVGWTKSSPSATLSSTESPPEASTESESGATDTITRFHRTTRPTPDLLRWRSSSPTACHGAGADPLYFIGDNNSIRKSIIKSPASTYRCKVCKENSVLHVIKRATTKRFS